MGSLFFLASGDFSFPFQFWDFLVQHIYVWSFNAGALNFDGILRLFVRLPMFAIFYATDNVTSSYAYLFLISAVLFFGFIYFVREFLKIQKRSIQVLVALLLTLNPIFLGNTAKIGLVLAAGMLPLLLAFVEKYVETKKPTYLIFIVFAWNISLLHPYCFVVNFGCSAVYFLAKICSWQTAKSVLLSGLKALGAFFLLSVYFILPLLSIGTLDKGAILGNIGGGTVNYADLVSYSNTGNVLNAFLFSKDVFQDFEFYTVNGKTIYVIGMLILYAVIFTILFLHKVTSKEKESNGKILILLSFFLLTILFATGTFLGIDHVITAIIRAPGGWAFRSPLKWQLYTPVAFFGLLALSLSRIRTKRNLIFASIVTLIAFFCINTHIFTNIFTQFITPRSIQSFQDVESEIQGKNTNILLVQDANYFAWAKENNDALLELNQVFNTETIQSKYVNRNSLSSISINGFQYIMSFDAKDRFDGFELWKTPMNGKVRLFRNTTPSPFFFSFAAACNATRANTTNPMGATQNEIACQHIQISPKTSTRIPGSTDITTPFFDPSAINITGIPSVIEANFDVQSDSEQTRIVIPKTVLDTSHIPLIEGSNLTTTTVPYLQFPIETLLGHNPLQLRSEVNRFENKIKNGSFEKGLWQNNVEDCNKSDTNGSIKMLLDEDQGNKSLQLEALHHAACTSQQITVKPNTTYLLRFDYQSPNRSTAKYLIRFNGKQATSTSAVFPVTDTTWHTTSQFVQIPENTTSIRLYLYARETDQKTNMINRYDNVSLIEIPTGIKDITVITEPTQKLVEPSSTTFEIINPTKKIVHIKGATTPFFLGMSESYHDKWQAQFDDANVHGWLNSWSPLAKPHRINDDAHVKLDGFLNAWYIDTSEYCEKQQLCHKNPDGSYDIDMVIEFFPQRWFYLGLGISGTTFAGCIGYLVYDGIRSWRKRKKEQTQIA